MRKTVLGLALAAFHSLSGLFVQVRAENQGITGKKLLINTAGRKLVVISKDPGISIAGSDPIGGADSSLSITGLFPFELPTLLWSTNSSGSVFKYKNPSAPSGPSSIKVVKIKPGLIKIVEKGGTIAAPNGPATIDVTLSLDGGTNTYCMSFSGTGDGNKFVVKDAVAGLCRCGNGVIDSGEQCDPADPSLFCALGCASDCSTCTPLPCEASTGGYCWFLADSSPGADCSSTCSMQGRAYDDAGTRAYAGSDGTDPNCAAVMSDLGFPLAASGQGCASGYGCIADAATESVIRCTSPATRQNVVLEVVGADHFTCNGGPWVGVVSWVGLVFPLLKETASEM